MKNRNMKDKMVWKLCVLIIGEYPKNTIWSLLINNLEKRVANWFLKKPRR